MTMVDFEFMPGDKVRTKLGDVGFVEHCNIDVSRIKRYYVKWSASGNWFIANSLQKVEEDA